jgi:hypothetical protein
MVPPAPAVAAAPTIAASPTIAAPIPARSMPAGVVPAIMTTRINEELHRSTDRLVDARSVNTVIHCERRLSLACRNCYS